MPKLFQRKKENFICAHCGFSVTGTGYTDHCPRCLWSKHCDINPGDRSCSCQGMMEPKEIETTGDRYIINYKCVKCGFKHRVKASQDDNLDEIIKLTKAYV